MIRAMNMPPKEEMAMGTMMSAPRPVEVRTGMRARIVVAEVMKAGWIVRRDPAREASLLVFQIDFRLIHDREFSKARYLVEQYIACQKGVPGHTEFVPTASAGCVRRWAR